MTGTLRSHYPEFAPNQIVTDGRLNELRAYLDEQTRATRVRLFGTGVVCGLAAALDDRSLLHLGAGFGVSPGGHLVEGGGAFYTHSRVYVDPGTYPPWRDAAGEPLSIRELLDESAAADARPPGSAKPLAPEDLKDRLLVLYLEHDPVHARSCPVTETQEEGIDVRLTVRALLVPGELAPLQPYVETPARVRLAPPTLADFVAAGGWQALYEKAFARARLDVTVPGAFADRGAVLGLDPALAADLGAEMATLRDLEGVGQLHHDLLRDLAQALDEALEAAGALAACGAGALGGRHLALGVVDAQGTSITAKGRHVFRPAAARDATRGRLERARRLFRRLAAMPGAFDAKPASGGVRLTPSHGEDRPLADRAVPAALRLADLEELWRPGASGDPLWSYHRRDPTGKGLEDLDVDGQRASLVRIEGHLDLDGDAALAAVAAERRRHNVAFEVLRVDLENVLKAEEAAFDQVTVALQTWRGEAAVLGNVTQAVRRGEAGSPEVLAQAQAVAAAETALGNALDGWIALRRSRAPACGEADLRAAWAVARGELSGFLHHLRGELAKPPAPGRRVPGLLLLDQVKQRMAERLAAGLAAARQIDPSRVQNAVAAIQGATEVDSALKELAGLATEALSEAIDALLDVLPADPDATHAELLAWRYGPFFSSLRYDVFRGSDPVEWPTAARALALYGRAATLCLAWEERRNGDLGVLANLQAAAGGARHLAGVTPGGTFLLVCAAGKVVADFALAGRLPCRCGADLSMVKPPPLPE